MADLAYAAEVIPEDELGSRVSELGNAMSHDYRGRNPLFVVMMKGALPFAADLTRRLDSDTEVDFLVLNRFGESGRIGIAMDLSLPVLDRNVLIIEDVVDTGLTLGVLRKMMFDRGAASVATASLFDKTRRRVTDVAIEYRGFEVGDEFLIGYGLDWNGYYRNLRSVWAVLDVERLTDDPLLLARDFNFI